MIRARARTGILLLGVLGSGCVYLNGLYNARQRFDDGERARVEGRADAAREAYDDAVRKAARVYRREPEGGWADDALYLLGRAYLRQGEYARAQGALEQAARRTDDPELLQGARLYLGAVLAQVGDRGRAEALLDEAVEVLAGSELEGEARFWRGRLLLAEGREAEAFGDLERAVAADADLRLPVLFQSLAHGIARDDTLRAVRAASGLLADPAAGVLADSISTLVRRAADRWGPGPAAALLAPARSGDWPPGPRDRLLLERVGLLAAAGDTLAVESEAGWAAQGSTPGAVAARLVVARIRLRRTQDVSELDRLRAVLLPAGGSPEVAELAADIRRVELLDGWGGTEDPVAWFAAAELARDRLGAPMLARGLFLRFAAEAPESPWAGKALLAALATTPDPRSDAALRAGLEARDADPYVAEARSDAPTGASLGELEVRLDGIMSEWLARADAEALRRDLFLRGADTLSADGGTGR